jgi:hypothetical protein
MNAGTQTHLRDHSKCDSACKLRDVKHVCLPLASERCSLPMVCQHACMHVQEACLSVSNIPYDERANQVIAQMPVRAANNTPAGDLIGLAANAPEEATLNISGTADEPAGLAPQPASQVTPVTPVSQEDLVPADTSSAVSAAAFWSACVPVLLHAALLLG